MRRVLVLSTLALAAGAPTAVAMSHSVPSSPPRQAATVATSPAPDGIVNFSRVDATVACGGSTEPAAFRALKAEGFRSVINLRRDSEPGVAEEAEVVEGAGLRYIHLPLDGANPDPAVADRFLEIIADPEIAPVYIHCASANRVGAIWAIKRVVVDGWTRERALEEGRAIGLKSPTLVEYVHHVLDARQ